VQTIPANTRCELPFQGIEISEYSIQNIVGTANLGVELDLPRLAGELEGAKYDPVSFPGLVLRLTNPKTAILMFRSGKLVCTGSRNLEQLDQSIRKVVARMRKLGFPVNENPDVTVQNTVASGDLGQEISLQAAVISLGLDRVEYEPEQFPGLVYRMDGPKVVVLLFASGRFVCTGARTIGDVGAAVAKLEEILRSLGLMEQPPSA